MDQQELATGRLASGFHAENTDSYLYNSASRPPKYICVIGGWKRAGAIYPRTKIQRELSREEVESVSGHLQFGRGLP